MKTFRKKRIVHRLLAFLFSIAILVFHNDIAFATDSNTTKQLEAQGTQLLQGSLSGYGYKYDSNSGSFTFTVSGAWSPFAGCTLKTEGFSSSSTLTISVYDSSGSCKTTQTLGPNENKANIAIFNVPTGTYTVKYSMSWPSSGSIQVWIY